MIKLRKLPVASPTLVKSAIRLLLQTQNSFIAVNEQVVSRIGKSDHWKFKARGLITPRINANSPHRLPEPIPARAAGIFDWLGNKFKSYIQVRE